MNKDSIISGGNPDTSRTDLSLSVTLITLNEERNIAEAIASVAWAKEIIVVDAESTDRTAEIARAAGAKVFVRPWPGYGQQKNFAQSQASSEWVLNVDADERVTSELKSQMQAACARAAQDSSLAGFEIPRKTFYRGQWIRFGGWYPNYLVRLSRKAKSRWTEPEIHEELKVEGRTEKLDAALIHYSFDSVKDQVLTNLRYAELGARRLIQKRNCPPGRSMMLLKAVGKFVETFILKQGFRDGMAGLIISINAAHSMFLKYAFSWELLEDRKSAP